MHKGHPRIPVGPLVLPFLHYLKTHVGNRDRKKRTVHASPLSLFKARNHVSGLLFLRALYISEGQGGVNDLTDAELRRVSFRDEMGVREFLNTLQ